MRAREERERWRASDRRSVRESVYIRPIRLVAICSSLLTKAIRNPLWPKLREQHYRGWRGRGEWRGLRLEVLLTDKTDNKHTHGDWWTCDVRAAVCKPPSLNRLWLSVSQRATGFGALVQLL